jgi:hypothetical protein
MGLLFIIPNISEKAAMEKETYEKLLTKMLFSSNKNKQE